MDYSALLAAHAREDPNGPATRQHRLYAGLRWAILGGQIAEGTRLPSTRALAEELGMARNSVLYAYEHLGTEGFLRSSRHGTVVAQLDLERGRGAIALDAARACTPTLSRRALALQTEQDDANRSLPLWPGMPALDAFPLAAWRRCMERAWRHAGARQLGYAPVQGHLPLRQAIAQYLRVSRGVRCTAEQVFISDGSQGGLELCARTLADVGDTAWIENPGYPGARAAFQAADLRLVPIGVDDEGLAPSAEDWRATPPRLIYITPSHQYPLGAMMSLERRLADRGRLRQRIPQRRPSAVRGARAGRARAGGLRRHFQQDAVSGAAPGLHGRACRGGTGIAWRDQRRRHARPARGAGRAGGFHRERAVHAAPAACGNSMAAAARHCRRPCSGIFVAS